MVEMVRLPLPRMALLEVPVRRVARPSRAPGKEGPAIVTPESGEYELPQMPGAKLIIDPECNWGMKRVSAALHTVYGLPDLMFNLLKNRLNLRLGFRPLMYGMTAHFDRKSGELRVARRMGFDDNAPLVADSLFESLWNSGQLRPHDPTKQKPEARQDFQRLMETLRTGAPQMYRRQLSQAKVDVLKSPVQQLSHLMGYQMRFWLRETFPADEVTVINDLYLKGRKRFIRALSRQYTNIDPKEIERHMAAFDRSNQRNLEEGRDLATGESFIKLREYVEAQAMPRVAQQIIQQLYEATQIEVMAGLTGQLLRQSLYREHPTQYKRVMTHRAPVLQHFKELRRHIRNNILNNPDAMAEIDRTVAQAEDPASS